MDFSSYTFKKNLSGNEYYNFLKYSLKYCEIFFLVVRNSIDLDSQGKQILESLKNFLVSREERAEWPGTKLLDDTASVFTFNFCIEAIQTLTKSVDNLFGWLQPNYPEDFCLIRKDGSPWLVTISHERDGYLLLTDDEFKDIKNNLPYLMLLKEE